MVVEPVELGNVVASGKGYDMAVVWAVLADVVPSSLPFAA